MKLLIKEWALSQRETNGAVVSLLLCVVAGFVWSAWSGVLGFVVAWAFNEWGRRHRALALARRKQMRIDAGLGD